jgi:hypothetical protein
MWYFCFTFNGKTHCIRIPILIDPFWKFRRPQPEPWLVFDRQPFEFAQDLRILATIADLSQELSPEFGRAVNVSVEQAFSSLKKHLPEGAELNNYAETPTQTAG